MNIVFDLLHPAHVNLFKHIIKDLNDGNNNVIVTCIERGKLPMIAKDELNPVPVHVIGKHKGSPSSVVFQANILRFFQLLKFLLGKNVDIGVSFGSFLLGAILRIFDKPNIHLSDDPERRINGILENLTSTERYLPFFFKPKGKIGIFHSLKEWAYLSPEYFQPNGRILQKYNVAPNKYIFIREVSTGSLNYLNQAEGTLSRVAEKINLGFEVILSLENKSLRNKYPPEWKILNEPVNDIHSLMYFSKIVISSGDSMAREGAMLGVPSVYSGYRKMKANEVLEKKGMLHRVSPKEVTKFVDNLVHGDVKVPDQERFRETLEKEWDDLNKFLLKKILDQQT